MRAAVPFVAFFLSGASSLVFQTLWTRLLHHVFGSTSVAMSSVLTAFMAGLGLGAFLAGRYADRIRRPLVAYALVELGVAGCGLLIPALVQPEGWLADVNAYLRNELGAESTGFLVLRFLCIFPILIVPTTLMGTTLPLLSRHFIAKDASADVATVSAGTLYAVNTAGAVAGTFLGGFVLMPMAGLAWANYAAVAINLALGIAVSAYALRAAHPSAPPEPHASPPPEPDDPATRAPPLAARPTPPDFPDLRPRKPNLAEPFTRSSAARRLALCAFAASGAAALCYEVVWSRALAMVLGSSIYSFTLILMTFLAGIAAGSAYVASCLQSRSSVYAGAIAAAILSAMAHAPLGIRTGVNTWALVTFVCAAAVFALARGLRDRSSPRLAITLMLCIPILSSIAEAIAISGDFSKISLSVNLLISSFLLIPLFLPNRPFTLLALVQTFIGIATFVSYAWQDEIPGTFARLVAGLSDLPNHVGSVQFFMFFTAALCTLPATLGMGAMFPLTLRIWAPDGQRIASHVGTVYTVNTLGSLAGAWLPGFVLLPTIGMERTLHVGIAMNFTIGAAFLAIALARTTPRRAWVLAAAVFAAVLVPAQPIALWAATADPSAPIRWQQSEMTLGAFRLSRMKTLLGAGEGRRPTVVYYKDGVSTTVTVERIGAFHSLKNNGKAEASDVPWGDMCTQVAVAAFPLLLHPRGPDGLDVAVIGFGSGVTVGAALKFPVRAVDAIELEPAVLEASRFFAHVNDLGYVDVPPYARAERLAILQDDARNYLASTQKRYDLIISEPSNPWITGVADLFTVEHVRLSKRRLKRGGLYAQWVQLYEVSPENIKIIYRTFASQFDYVRVFAAVPGGADTILIASDEPIPLDAEAMRKAMALPGIERLMRAADAHAPYDVLARLLLKDKGEVLQYAQVEQRYESGSWKPYPAAHNGEARTGDGVRRTPVSLNTDDNAKIEFAAPRDLIGYERDAGYTDSLYQEDWPYGRFDVVPRVGRGDDAARAYAELSITFLGHGRIHEASVFAERSMDDGDVRRTDLAVRLLDLLTSEAADDPAFTVTSADAGDTLSDPELKALQRIFDAAHDASRDETDPGGVLAQIDAAIRANAKLDVPAVRFLKGYLVLLANGSEADRADEAAKVLSDLALQNEPYARAHPEVYYFAARAYEYGNNLTAAVRWMRRHVELVMEAESAREASADRATEEPLGDGDADSDDASMEGEEKRP